MNITLRKANAIQKEIQDLLRSINCEIYIKIDEFEDPTDVIPKANDRFFEQDRRRYNLLLAYYNIRNLVGVANAQNEISNNLTQAAFIDKRIQQLAEICSAPPITDLGVIQGHLEKIKNSVPTIRSYSYDSEIKTSLLSEEQIQQARTEVQKLKKQKQKINDQILEANIKTEIPLSTQVEEILTQEGLI